MYYRLNSDGNAVIFNDDGSIATQIMVDNLYPVDSNLCTKYEHTQGIVLSVEDAIQHGIIEER